MKVSLLAQERYDRPFDSVRVEHTIVVGVRRGQILDLKVAASASTRDQSSVESSSRYDERSSGLEQYGHCKLQRYVNSQSSESGRSAIGQHEAALR